MGKVSIITPVFNAERFLSETLASVRDQTYANWEHVLVDDCSSDDSVAIIEQFQRLDSRFKLFRLPKNAGSGVARNLAIREATGRYIAFLDSDDLWPSNKLARHIELMQAHGASFSHTSYGYIDEEGKRIKDTFHVSDKPVGYFDLLKRTEISCLTAIYDAEVLGKYYMSEHRRKQDYALWLSILKSGVTSLPIDEELAFYRQRKNSATSNKLSLIGKHIAFLQDTQGFSLPLALYYTAFWGINGFVRYFLR